MGEFIASLKLEQQKAVLLGRIKLEVPRYPLLCHRRSPC